MKKTICLLLTCFALVMAYAKELTFPIYAGSHKFMPINQIDALYCSAIEFGNTVFENNFFYPTDNKENRRDWNYIISRLGFVILDSSLFNPISHEEAHRAVLTSKNIGSISQPILKFLNPFKSVAYVIGVKDETLKNLRDTDFPSFIRLHTAGLESDYSIMQKSFAKLVFDLDDVGNKYDYELPMSFWVYLDRSLSITMYESLNLFSKGIGITEEDDELARDIVGDDVCGMIHHLFNPEAEYHRYFSKDDFSPEEKSFLNRVALKTILNFPYFNSIFLRKIIPMDFNKVHLNCNLGYSLAPFGDYIDENIYIKIDDVLYNSMNLIFTARQYENKENWFPEFIIKCEQFSPLSWLTLTASGNLWWQPENLSFTTDKAVLGGAVSMGFNVYPFSKTENAKYQFGLNMNVLYKTKGFMQEIMNLNEGFLFTTGISIRY